MSLRTLEVRQPGLPETALSPLRSYIYLWLCDISTTLRRSILWPFAIDRGEKKSVPVFFLSRPSLWGVVIKRPSIWRLDPGTELSAHKTGERESHFLSSTRTSWAYAQCSIWFQFLFHFHARLGSTLPGFVPPLLGSLATSYVWYFTGNFPIH